MFKTFCGKIEMILIIPNTLKVLPSVIKIKQCFSILNTSWKIILQKAWLVYGEIKQTVNVFEIVDFVRDLV